MKEKNLLTNWRVLSVSIGISLSIFILLVAKGEWSLAFLIFFTHLTLLPFIFLPGFQNQQEFKSDRGPMTYFMAFSLFLAVLSALSLLSPYEIEAINWRGFGLETLSSLRESFTLYGLLAILFSMTGVLLNMDGTNDSN